MGNREKPVSTDNRALAGLAEWLRERRMVAKLTYRQLADRTGLHATTLQRAASGQAVPQLQVVLAYARGCEARADQAKALWRQAQREERRAARQGTASLPAPRPELVRDFADLSAAMLDLYEKAFAPSMRTMEERAGGFGVLPRSSAHRIVTKRAMPRREEQFIGFLRACEVPEEERQPWVDAWSRAWRHQKADQDEGYKGYIGPVRARARWTPPGPAPAAVRSPDVRTTFGCAICSASRGGDLLEVPAFSRCPSCGGDSTY